MINVYIYENFKQIKDYIKINNKVRCKAIEEDPQH